MSFSAPTVVPAGEFTISVDPACVAPASRADDDSEVDWIQTFERTLLDSAEHGDVEIAITTDSSVGAIHARDGRIAWVLAGEHTARLSSVLTRRSGVKLDVLRAAYRRCRERGANFAEWLIEERLIDRTTVRESLLEHNARQFQMLLERGPKSFAITRRRRAYDSALLFTFSEVIAAMRDLAFSDPPLPNAPLSDPQPRTTQPDRTYHMDNIKQSLEDILKIDGAIATALVDWESGLTLGTAGGGSGFDIELAASGNTSVVRSKMTVMKQLGIGGTIEDILITLTSQYHLIRPLGRVPSLFLYVAIDKQRGNLGLARHRLRQIEEALVL